MVTKQQQLEWLAKHIGDWCGNRPSAYLMSCDEIGFIVGLATQVTPKELLCGGHHLITRQEWQQERDKVSGKPEVDNSWHERGELPPVGCECEVAPKSGGTWIKAVILAVTNHNVIMLVNDEPLEVVSRASNVIFRPLRTEREKAIEEMAAILVGCEKYAITQNVATAAGEFLYDAGCRMVKP